MLPITTTLTRIRAHHPCEDGWAKLLAGLGKTKADADPLAYATILRTNGLADALWCCRAEQQHATIWRMAAVRFARRVQHLMKDQRSIAALDVAERHAQGLATDDELAAAEAAARDAARDGERDAAWNAAWNAAWDAAWDAAWNAAAAARDAEREAQTAIFLELVGGE